jgi:hypothetical protein
MAQSDNKTYTYPYFFDSKKKETNNRKDYPIFSGVLKYFPLALKELSRISVIGNNQHNNGEELVWDRSKSKDHLDAAIRHLLDHASGNEFDDDGARHLAKVCWRVLAQLQVELEKENK